MALRAWRVLQDSLHGPYILQLPHENLCRVYFVGGVFKQLKASKFLGYIKFQVSCIMAGLGAYPASSKPRPGQGPTITPVNYSEREEVMRIKNSKNMAFYH